jgi:hypothetical protein
MAITQETEEEPSTATPVAVVESSLEQQQSQIHVVGTDSVPDKLKTSNTDTTHAPQEANTERDPDLDFPLSAADGVIKKPFLQALEIAKPAALPELTIDQTAKYDSVLKTVSSWTGIPTGSTKNAPTSPLTDDERMFLTRECLLRYLRASKWNVADSVNRIRATLVWRREYIDGKLTADYISVENETGKQVILGYDIQGRPCLYLLPSRQNTKVSDRQVQHLVFMLERIIDLMGPDQETLALLVDFNETKAGQNATISQAKQTLYLLQHHYPERLGRALVTNGEDLVSRKRGELDGLTTVDAVPFMIWGFFKIVSPFIDPLTREKLKFNEDLRGHIPPAQLMRSAGGDVEFEYDHSVYWPALTQLADRRRHEYRERWIKGGRRVGEHENYLKGGTDKNLAANQGDESGGPGPELENPRIDISQANGGAASRYYSHLDAPKGDD